MPQLRRKVQMRNFSIRFGSAAFMALCLSLFPSLAHAQTSVNGFRTPECTWFCDVFTSYYGWTLRFSPTSGRDAKNWAAMITNAQSVAPRPWSILVLGGIPDVPAGHVAIVRNFNASNGSITVWHSNYPSFGNDVVGYIGAAQIVQTTFEPVPGRPGWIRRIGGSQQFPIVAFLWPR
jgi:hypothetical protein